MRRTTPQQTNKCSTILGDERRYEQGGRAAGRQIDAQLQRYVGMLIKSFQVFYYIFLVVPSLDFMLEVKSSQKLMVHISPYGSHIKWL